MLSRLVRAVFGAIFPLVLATTLLSACGGGGSSGHDAPTLVSIQVSAGQTARPAGLPIQYTATATYSDGSSRDITSQVAWSSSDASHATVDANGLVRTLVPGPVAITASFGGVTSNASALTVTAATLASIQITPAVASKAAGLTQAYTAVGTYSDASTQDISTSVQWTSSAAAVATISANGLATTVAAGSATIVASVGGIGSNVATLTVTSAVLGSLTITPVTASKPAGIAQPYSAIGHYSDGTTQDLSSTVTWTSSTTASATIAASGVASTLAAGSTSIGAALNGVQSNAATLTVTPAIVTSVAVTPGGVGKAVGLTQQYVATGTFSDASTLDLSASASWLSSDTTKATIGSTGLAQTLAIGTTSITASFDGTTSAPVVLTVTPAVLQSIQISPSTTSRSINQTVQYSAIGTYSDATTQIITSSVDWHSSDTAKATISMAGLATAVASGAPAITATSSGFTSNAATLTVTPLGQGRATTSMLAGRGDHKAVLLQDGSVLVVGGVSDQYVLLNTAETFDPATETWTATGTMNQARQLPTAVRLADGRVLASGGFRGPGLLNTSADLYNPATRTWSPTGSMLTPRHFHASVLLSSGQVLVAGGRDTNQELATCELYDPVSGQWTFTGSMSVARGVPTLTMLPNGKVLAVGANGSATADLYDPATGSWTPAANMIAAHYLQTATLLSDGRVMVTGGDGANNAASNVAELYDPTANSWTLVAPMMASRSLHAAAVISTGFLMVFGGVDPNSALASTEVYNPVTNSWTAGTPLTVARRLATTTTLLNGQVLVAGGYPAGAPSAAAELY
ncbi:hypothetical protein BH09PSE6_BH09PSE6_07720 [soil metagenome]